MRVAPSARARPTGMECTSPPSRKCRSPIRTGGNSPGTEHDATTGSVRSPCENHTPLASSMQAATHWKGTSRSSNRLTGR